MGFVKSGVCPDFSFENTSAHYKLLQANGYHMKPNGSTKKWFIWKSNPSSQTAYRHDWPMPNLILHVAFKKSLTKYGWAHAEGGDSIGSLSVDQLDMLHVPDLSGEERGSRKQREHILHILNSRPSFDLDLFLEWQWPCSDQELSISNFPLQPHQKETLYSAKNLALHSLIRWKPRCSVAALGSLFSDRSPMCSSSIVFSVRVIVCFFNLLFC